MNKFKIYKDCNAGGFIDKSKIRLTVDTQEDFMIVKNIFANENFSININYKKLLELV
jgi:spore coat polysaccharide biosynthesis protein SpsF (cytidylyltransferase family)